MGETLTEKPQKEQRVVTPRLSRHSKTPLELNHTADDIPGFHEVECSLNVGVRLVCKTCKQTTKKAPGLLRHSKPLLELNHSADYIPGFHEVESFLKAGDCLVLKICKQTTQKSPRETLMSPTGLLRHSNTPLELNHTADDIPGFHEVECFLNIIEANLLCDHRIEIEAPL